MLSAYIVRFTLCYCIDSITKFRKYDWFSEANMVVNPAYSLLNTPDLFCFSLMTKDGLFPLLLSKWESKMSKPWTQKCNDNVNLVMSELLYLLLPDGTICN